MTAAKIISIAGIYARLRANSMDKAVRLHADGLPCCTVEMRHWAELQRILTADGERLRLLEAVHSLGLPDCWVGAGFVRNAVWDHLHGRTASKPQGDIDVIWYDPMRVRPEDDRALDVRLGALDRTCRWSVKNQVRMHLRNADAPYSSAVDAMRHWPETATAVAVRLTQHGHCECLAPYGLDDLFGLLLRPTPDFQAERYPVFAERVRSKVWLTCWPLLRLGR